MALKPKKFALESSVMAAMVVSGVANVITLNNAFTTQQGILEASFFCCEIHKKCSYANEHKKRANGNFWTIPKRIINKPKDETPPSDPGHSILW